MKHADVLKPNFSITQENIKVNKKFVDFLFEMG